MASTMLEIHIVKCQLVNISPSPTQKMPQLPSTSKCYGDNSLHHQITQSVLDGDLLGFVSEWKQIIVEY